MPKVTDVKYLKEYLLKVTFSNKIVKVVDLKNFIFSAANPMITDFKNLRLFRTVKVEHGHLAWGDAMHLSADSLYKWKTQSFNRKKELHHHS